MSSFYHFGSTIHAVIDLFERLQFLTFLLFINTDLPPAQIDFISSIFRNTMELGEPIKEYLIHHNLRNFQFSSKHDINVSLPFKIENLDSPKI